MLMLCLRLLRGGRSLLGLVRWKRHLLDDSVGPRFDSTAIVRRILLEMRKDRLPRNEARHGVRHESAGAITCRDPDLAFIGSDQEHDAVVVLGASDLPIATQPVRVILNREALEAVDRGNYELASG